MDYTCGGILTHPRDMTRRQVKDALYLRLSAYRSRKRLGLPVSADRRAALAFLALWRGLA